MSPCANLRPVGQPGALVPPVPPVPHDLSNRAFIAEATVRRSLRTARATPALPDRRDPPFMKINIGLNDEARLEIGRMLNLLLADESVLAATLRDYHWNVTGPEFPMLHAQFGRDYAQCSGWIDEVAERARAIGVGARGNWGELAKAARCSADPGLELSAEHMLSELLALHEEMIVQLRTDAEACAKRFGDAGTADFLTGLMAQHEKAAWMLRAQLETETDGID